MLGQEDIEKLMDMLAREDRESFEAMLSSMTTEQLVFFEGYVNGYAHGVRHAQQAEVEGCSEDAV